MKKEIWNESNISDQTDKVFIVTGPTSGLGKETSIVLARKNATVIMAARDLKKAESVKKEVSGCVSKNPLYPHTSYFQCLLLMVLAHKLFPFLGKCPPRKRIITFHEIYH